MNKELIKMAAFILAAFGIIMMLLMSLGIYPFK